MKQLHGSAAHHHCAYHSLLSQIKYRIFFRSYFVRVKIAQLHIEEDRTHRIETSARRKQLHFIVHTFYVDR